MSATLKETTQLQEALDVIYAKLDIISYEEISRFAPEANIIAMSQVVDSYLAAGIKNEQVVEICDESESPDSIIVVGQNIRRFAHERMMHRNVEPREGEYGLNRFASNSEYFVDLATHKDHQKVEAICEVAVVLFDSGFSVEQISDLVEVKDPRIILDLPLVLNELEAVEIWHADAISFAINATSYEDFKYRISRIQRVYELDGVALGAEDELECLTNELNGLLDDYLAVQADAPERVAALATGGVKNR